MNAVFFGHKQEQGAESEAGCSKEVVACTSTVPVTLPTRKHVLQVSTYQVNNYYLTLIRLLNHKCF